MIWTVEFVMPRKRHERAGKGWSTDAQIEAELETPKTEIQTT